MCDMADAQDWTGSDRASRLAGLRTRSDVIRRHRTALRRGAVLAVAAGIPVTEVAAAADVTRQTVHRWIAEHSCS